MHIASSPQGLCVQASKGGGHREGPWIGRPALGTRPVPFSGSFARVLASLWSHVRTLNGEIEPLRRRRSRLPQPCSPHRGSTHPGHGPLGWGLSLYSRGWYQSMRAPSCGGQETKEKVVESRGPGRVGPPGLGVGRRGLGPQLGGGGRSRERAKQPWGRKETSSQSPGRPAFHPHDLPRVSLLVLAQPSPFPPSHTSPLDRQCKPNPRGRCGASNASTEATTQRSPLSNITGQPPPTKKDATTTTAQDTTKMLGMNSALGGLGGGAWGWGLGVGVGSVVGGRPLLSVVRACNNISMPIFSFIHTPIQQHEQWQSACPLPSQAEASWVAAGTRN